MSENEYTAIEGLMNSAADLRDLRAFTVLFRQTQTVSTDAGEFSKSGLNVEATIASMSQTVEKFGLTVDERKNICFFCAPTEGQKQTMADMDPRQSLIGVILAGARTDELYQRSNLQPISSDAGLINLGLQTAAVLSRYERDQPKHAPQRLLTDLRRVSEQVRRDPRIRLPKDDLELLRLGKGLGERDHRLRYEIHNEAGTPAGIFFAL
jgi:hypothetical protein